MKKEKKKARRNKKNSRLIDKAECQGRQESTGHR